MDMAVIGQSRKPYEKRVAVHPRILNQLPPEVVHKLHFEKGYGERFGVSDEQMESWTGNPMRTREELFRTFKTVILPKPVLADFQEAREGTTFWGWIHSVQSTEVVESAISKKMTLIALENMNGPNGRGHIHLFHKNNEMAGYCGVQDALRQRGIDGNYGPEVKAVVLSYGSVSRGAIHALKGHGFHDITVYTKRPQYLVGMQIPGPRYRRMWREGKDTFVVHGSDGKPAPLINRLTKADIIINGILQDPLNPVFFIRDGDIEKFRKPCLIADISCDKGMSFSFSSPTSMEEPIRKVGNISYYAVDHTPTILWDSASWEISQALMPYLIDMARDKMGQVIQQAMDIKDGLIINEKIIKFQNRSGKPPFAVQAK